MTSADLTIQRPHRDQLSAILLREDGKEHAAYVILGSSKVGADPFTGEPRLRLMVREVLPVEDGEIISNDFQHISWRTERFVKLLARAEREGCVVAIAHSHPGGPAEFSDQDNANEAELYRLAANRNGPDAMVVSLLMCGGGEFIGRIWISGAPLQLTAITSVGSRWHRSSRIVEIGVEEAFDRQTLALGADFTSLMRSLRIGVVGAGGTGSPLLQQLARMGAGYVGIFDPDIVEVTNLNRLHGATIDDARDGRKKIDVAKREIERMGLGTQVATFDAWIGSELCRDALKSMDIIFGCTDDHDGRGLLNRLAYYYLIPVIDLGLALRVAERGKDRALEAEGRVTVLEPGAACLLCRRVVNPAIAAEEALKRTNPEEYERRKVEAYVRGEGNPAPAVVSFTTSVATMAIEELIHRLTGFRGGDGPIGNRVRRFTRMEDVRPGATTDRCRVCGNIHIHGAGDVQPFLGRVG